jgi:hypothetical protein
MSVLALKVDIDTYQGMREGLPRIVEVLERRGIRASFYISFGPDRSGLAALQLLRPAFLLKMLKTRAVSTYGIKTALYGTLLKAPLIGCSFPEDLRRLDRLGHETACHAWDHRLWQDWLGFMGESSIRKWLDAMVQSFTSILGEKPSAFGAPGWHVDERVLRMIREYDFSYVSCTRAQKPFIFSENGLLEIPSNLPCIEEVGTAGVINALVRNAGNPDPQILPVHTEVEGGTFKLDFETILDRAISLGYIIVRMCDISRDIDRTTQPVRALKIGHIPGRAFTCAV